MNSIWHPGNVMTACCGANILRHGIHAFTTSAEAVAYMGEGRKPIRHVFGEVSLWGRGSRDITSELRRSYGVETDWTEQNVTR